jgi:hypothetical protein
MLHIDADAGDAPARSIGARATGVSIDGAAPSPAGSCPSTSIFTDTLDFTAAGTPQSLLLRSHDRTAACCAELNATTSLTDTGRPDSREIYSCSG